MGASLCGRGSKNRTAEHAAKGNAIAGYTLESFVSDNLVPVKGFCCTTPMNAERANFVQEQVSVLNKMFSESLAEGALDYMGPSSDDVPVEAVCIVYLDTAKVEGNALKSFDFNQEGKLEVKIYGLLLFPPSVHWTDADINAALQEPSRRPAQGAAENLGDEDGRWHLRVEVWAVLERRNDEHGSSSDYLAQEMGVSALARTSMQTTPALDATPGVEAPAPHVARLDVKCLHLVIDGRSDAGGDAMIESWLPVDNVLQDIEGLLETRLMQAVSIADA
eukprot:TRINITY_DN74603_c0_g1_i1.p1 TRINITY_DN74603_c0_g1~~TRINITY_DN74603_c0_g1_i1.p1  ORF type:complete len:277 (-),score=59.55 TRINITY_DN74603_c0_g1_i1:76-906(-)